ncbi:MAG: DUF393 domain-containing protein [Bacteroidetes bacterium]|nr:DUF393 domain-containing protein [Bacteroidota bacterium]
MKHINAKSIVFFDGSCILCNYAVNFIIRNDKHNVFHFAPLQWEVSKKILNKDYPYSTLPNTLIYLENGKLYKESNAILRIFRKLPFPHYLFYSFIIIPKFIRDIIYKFISKKRYSWFGKYDSCIAPSQDIKNKFLLNR